MNPGAPIAETPMGRGQTRLSVAADFRIIDSAICFLAGLTPRDAAPIFLFGSEFLRMSSTAFGEHLKREREMRGVSLEEISAATRINTRYLAALESETWSDLPGGVFNRGFIRSVGRYLGLDEDNLVAEYELHTRGSQAPHVAALPPMGANRKPWAAIAVIAALIVAALVGGWFLFAHYRQQIEAFFQKRHADSLVSEKNPAKYSDAVVANSAEGDPATNRGPQAGANGATNGTGIAVDPRASDPAPALDLKMVAGKPADVKVIADGQTVFDGHIEAGEAKAFSAREGFEVSSSEASALLLELDGQTVPPMGQPGQAGSVTLTRNDLKFPGGGPH
jgi:cytoskeleton protein RodZ